MTSVSAMKSRSGAFSMSEMRLRKPSRASVTATSDAVAIGLDQQAFLAVVHYQPIGS